MIRASWSPLSSFSTYAAEFIVQNPCSPGSRAPSVPLIPRGSKILDELPLGVDDDGRNQGSDQDHPGEAARPRRKPAHVRQLGEPAQQGGAQQQDGVGRRELAEKMADHEQAEEPNHRDSDRAVPRDGPGNTKAATEAPSRAAASGSPIWPPEA